ncbi:glycosyltransferase family 92 domain-containing protein [Ditylenchus destructor]|nr:glycosyltransferase family 92 domain-containing protein [Ditylenchus destructor]
MVVPFQKPLTKCIKVGLRHLSYCIGMPPLVILLGFAVSWTGFRYAQFVSSLTTNSRSASINHIFLLNTFIYRNSTTFGTRNHDTLVAFFITPEGTESRFAYCAAEDALTDIEQGIPATVSLLSESQNCRMNAYVLHCPLEIVRSIRQRISVPIGIGFLGSPPVKVLPTDLSVRRHTSLVFCMGQLFGFERWPALLAALELHRYLGVERVILYVHTVSSHIFQLLQEFADTYPEFLDIRPTLNLPQSMDLDFDPNMEVEHSYERFHQYICLFEHRENSEFVALLEPENVLIPSETFSPPGELLNILRKVAAQNMKTVLFTPNFAHGLCSNSACDSQLSVELELKMGRLATPKEYTQRYFLFYLPDAVVNLEGFLRSGKKEKQT